ncbi:hypothetical protein B566_EDAN005198, partial [Ephemera danica]
MSVSDPLLKDLKACTAKLLEDSSKNGIISDTSLSVQPFCETLELIIMRGLNDNYPLRKPESWYWMENIASPRFETAFCYGMAVESAKVNPKIMSPRGRFRLLVRTCLVQNCLHVPVEKLIHMKPTSNTYFPGSILGDEILGEIFLSVLLQCSKLKFQLDLNNAMFLDETWQIGLYRKLEIVPCKTLGICVGFVQGKGIVVNVEPASVAAEDEKVQVGDVIDEINGHPVIASVRGKLGSIMRQAAGKPISLALVKAKYEDGLLYPPLRKLHAKLGLNSKDCQPSEVLENKPVIGSEHKQPVQLEILEMGVRVSDRNTSKIMFKNSYMEISSCGRNERMPSLFAYIAGPRLPEDSLGCVTLFVSSELSAIMALRWLPLLLLCVRGQASAPRPNVLLLLADDMGWGDLGVNVPQFPSNTPHLDALSNQGLRLTDFHAGASVCTPSRAALLTGRMGLRTGVIQNFAASSVAGLPRNETTLAEILKEAGYRTAMFGKWHLGTRPSFHPLDRGFDSYLGVPYSLDMGCTDPPGSDLPPQAACPRHLENNNLGDDDMPTEPLALPLYSNRLIIHQPVALKSLAKRYATFGERFIKKESRSPFFLYGAFSHVHVPLAYSDRFKNATGRGKFANTLAEMDWIVSRLMRAVDSRNNSTLIWFISDNGPWDVKCSLAGSSGPFRGEWQRYVKKGGGGSAAKMTVWEAGHRVPAFLRWSTNNISNIKGGVSDALLSALDVFPTIASLAGISLPAHRDFDGINLAEDLIKRRTLKGHTELFHPNSGASGPPGEIGAVRVGHYKTVHYAGGAPACSQPASHARKLSPPLVFNLSNDLAEDNPITNHSKADSIIRQATKALQRLMESVNKDNITKADYTKDHSARPCCDPTLPSC